eukprot:TRINITY_DN9792_c0_g2_i1.p1 TRINITY_DN9792_c0_g2~~TRINITY_DN9792_c0_g2_i1.p1  ORF type:complete len:260 (-),score=56.66 TRINITY_DN9792_c0_g2_i1:120-899(-)
MLINQTNFPKRRQERKIILKPTKIIVALHKRDSAQAKSSGKQNANTTTIDSTPKKLANELDDLKLPDESNFNSVRTFINELKFAIGSPKKRISNAELFKEEVMKDEHFLNKPTRNTQGGLKKFSSATVANAVNKMNYQPNQLGLAIKKKFRISDQTKKPTTYRVINVEEANKEEEVNNVSITSLVKMKLKEKDLVIVKTEAQGGRRVEKVECDIVEKRLSALKAEEISLHPIIKAEKNFSKPKLVIPEVIFMTQTITNN